MLFETSHSSSLAQVTAMKFSSILKKINFKSHKSMLKTGAILFWTDMKRLLNWNIDNLKSNSLSRGQLGSKSNDKLFLSILKMWQCYKYFFGDLIFALTAWTLSGNHLKCFSIWGNSFYFHNKRLSRLISNTIIECKNAYLQNLQTLHLTFVIKIEVSQIRGCECIHWRSTTH